MNSELFESAGEEKAGLPPVAPPSGKHILQLFLVPGLIVAVLVVGYLLWTRFTQSWYTPESFLSKLDNPDPDVRWRAADDLAQVLLRNEALAANSHFALDLTERLQRALDAYAPRAKASGERLAKLSTNEQTSEWKAQEADRNFIEYLSACLENFLAPVGLPLLCQMATKPDGADPATLGWLHRRAVRALADLGDNLKRFDKLAADRQQVIIAELEQEGGTSDRGQWALIALRVLKGRLDNRPQACGVDAALARCADARDPFVRELTAIAITHWQGDAAENARMEKALVKLLHDSGLGADDKSLWLLFHDQAVRHDVDDDPRQWSLAIQSQAAWALTRRDSDKLQMDVLAELLDEQRQLQNHRTKLKDGTAVPDEALAYATIGNTLKAIVDLHQKDPKRDLKQVYPALKKLTDCPNLIIRTEAKRALVSLGSE